MRRSFLMLALGLATLSLAAPPHSPIRDCNHLFSGLSKAGVDSSVEMELGSTRATLALFTSTDGTLRPALGKAYLPPELEKTLRAAYPEVADPKDIPWDALDHESQIELIQHAALVNKQDFFEARKVPGLKYRDEIELKFPTRTEFMGRSYAAGTHKFKSADVFGSTAIEFKSPDSMTQNLGFELHLRSPELPSRTLKDAWTIERGLGYRPGNLHQHVVAEIPLEKIKADPGLQAARMAEYYRRINLYAEMKALLRGVPITENIADAGYVNFGNMRSENILSIYDYFAAGASAQLESTNKIAWVGMRGSDAYNGTRKLWGLEFRDLSPKMPEDELGRMMDAAQSSLVRDDYGIPEEKMRRWLLRPESLASGSRYSGSSNPRIHPKRAGDEVMETGYAARVWDAEMLYSSLDPSLKKLLNFGDVERSQLAKSLGQAHQRDLAVTMLSKNWSQDPLFFENPEVLARIQQVQAQALRRLMAGEAESSVMKYFIRRSGIYYMFEKSLGI